MASPLSTLKAFLLENLDKRELDQLIDNMEDDLSLFVDDNFFAFSEAILRKLVDAALKTRDENVKIGRKMVSDRSWRGLPAIL